MRIRNHGHSNSDTSKGARRPLMMALEARVMFDAAVVADAAHALTDPATATHADSPAAVEVRAADPARDQGRKEVAFVDTSLKDYKQLEQGIREGVGIVEIDARQSGLAQVSAWAATHSGYDAIHILSHAAQGTLYLGSDVLSTVSLSVMEVQADLAQIGHSLNSGGDLLLYGCDLALGSEGSNFVLGLARSVDRTVDASTDATGAAALGGNWTLETQRDGSRAIALDLSGYDGLLTRPTTGTTNFDTLDGSTTVLSTGQTSLTVSNFLGWNFQMQLNSAGSGSNEMIIVEKDGSSSVETVDALSDGVKQITYLSVKPNDSSLFTLNSITVVMDGYDSSFSGGTVQLVGYLNGSAVSGANLSQFVSDIANSGSAVTFNVSANSNFAGIDSFRVLAANGHTITGLLGVGAINATGFHFPGPTLTASGGSSAYSSGSGLAVAVDGGMLLSDSASATQTSATVAISGNFHSSEDVLSFTNVDSTTHGNITGSYNSGTGVLTLSSSGSTATNAQWQAALEAVKYQNSSLTPNTSSRTVSFVITDAASNTSSTVNKTVTVASNSAPAIANLNGDSNTYYAGGGAVKLDSGTAASTSDTDTASFNGGNVTVHVSANAQSGEDALGIDTSGSVALSSGTSVGSTVIVGGVAIGSIASNGDGVGGHDLIVTLNSNATPTRVSTLLDALTYNNTAAGIPNTATRSLQVTVNDGRGGTSPAASVSMAINAAPVLTASGGSASFTAGDNTTSTPVAIDSGIQVSDNASATLASGTVSISGNFHSGEDVLDFNNSNSSTYGNIASSYNAGTGVMTLTSAGSTATLAQWQAALRAITYTDSAITPNTATRTISFLVADGNSNSSTAATRTITVAATDQTPIATTSAGNTAFVAGDNATSTPVAVDAAITLSDLDNATLASASVAVTGNFQSGEDVLSLTNSSAVTYGNIAGSYNTGTGVLSLSSGGATASVAQWQAALRAVTYTDSAVTPNTADRSIAFVVSDGTQSSAAATKLVAVTATDQTPLVTASGGSTAFTAGDNSSSTPVVVDRGLLVSDLDNAALASATVAITGNLQSAEDVLAFTNDNASTYGNIAASYGAGSGVLSLTSSGATASLTQWQAALRAVRYTDTAITPVAATRTVSFTVSDGSKTSAAATRGVSITQTDQTPIVSTTGTSGSYALNPAHTAAAIDDGLTVSDLDNTTLAGATVALTGNFQSGEDVLAFTNNDAAAYGNIAASYNAGTGVLTLGSGGATASVQQWQDALRAVTYADTSNTPNTALRSVAFTLNDGTKTSASATRNFAIEVPTPVVSGLTSASDTGTSSSDGLTAYATPSITGSALANSTVTVYVDAQSAGTTSTDSNGEWAFTLGSSLADGSHALTAMASIGPTNSALSGAYTITIDTLAPAAPAGLALTPPTDTGASNSDAITSDTHPEVSGTAEVDSVVSIYVDGVTAGTTTTNGNGNWSFAFGSALAGGNRTITATATDVAGNTSSVSGALGVTIDTQAPAAPSTLALTSVTDTGSSNADGITANNTPTLSGSAEADSTVTIYLDSQALGTTTADSSGNWTYSLSSPLADGSHSLAATATDAAGNVSSSSSALGISIDTAPPDAPTVVGLTSGTDTGASNTDGITSNAQPEVTGTAEAGSIVTV
ncbi:MAG: DUF4347 domain-containing protein, partial [Rhodocyclaceae bacterium]|nr:DUF4347 domain-containing protein [Rhodocyclaceae bacterium]